MNTRPFAQPVPRVNTLVDKYLPMMHPAALKHEYLPSVANALLHRQAVSQPAADGSRKAIGFADYRRRLPLVLILDQAADTGLRVTHAFVPNMNHPDEKALVEKLQEHEHEWARERGLPKGRDIVGYLTRNNSRRDQTNRHGLPDYEGDPFTEVDLKDAHRNWFATDFIDPELEIKTRDGQMVHVDKDPDARWKLEENVSDSVTMTLEHLSAMGVDGPEVWPDRRSEKADRAAEHGPRSMAFAFDDQAARRNHLKRGRIRIEMDYPDAEPDQGPSY